MASQGTTGRYKHTRLFVDEDDNNTMFLGTRVPISYVDDRENSIHVVKSGDTLEHLADRYFDGFANAHELWWVIGEFQPTPILDPTRTLKSGTILVIPSRAFVHTLINKNGTLFDEL